MNVKTDLYESQAALSHDAKAGLANFKIDLSDTKVAFPNDDASVYELPRGRVNYKADLHRVQAVFSDDNDSLYEFPKSLVNFKTESRFIIAT